MNELYERYPRQISLKDGDASLDLLVDPSAQEIMDFAAALPSAGRFGGFGLAPKPPAALAFFLAAAATPRRGGAVCGASAAAEQPSRRTALIVSALHGEEPPNHPRFPELGT